MIYEWIRALINAYEDLRHWCWALFCERVIYIRGIRFCKTDACLCEKENCRFRK